MEMWAIGFFATLLVLNSSLAYVIGDPSRPVITLLGLPSDGGDISIKDQFYFYDDGTNSMSASLPGSVAILPVGSDEKTESKETANSSCNFEKGFCGWMQKSGWSVTNSTLNEQKFRCLLYNKKADLSDKSDLVSPAIEQSKDGYCFHFHLFLRMDQTKTNKLFIGVVQGATADGKTVSGDMGNKWNPLKMQLMVESNFRLVFQVDRQEGKKFGNLMLGNFKLNYGKC